MAEAVIVATARTPIGRANKGSLVAARPDDMSAFIISDVLGKVPDLPRDEVEDVIWGTGQPGGEQGYNVARVAAVMAGLDSPGVTVNRYCSSSLQTIRMAAHTIMADMGNVFVAGGVECVSRYQYGAADNGPHNALFADAEARTASRTTGSADTWAPPEGLPDIYMAMGQTAENVAAYKNVSRQAQDEWGVRSQNRAEAARDRGFFEREITPYTLPDGTVVNADEANFRSCDSLPLQRIQQITDVGLARPRCVPGGPHESMDNGWPPSPYLGLRTIELNDLRRHITKKPSLTC